MALSTLLPIAAVSATVGGAGWWWKRGSKGPTLEERFQSWIMAQESVNDELKTWFTELSPEEIKRLLTKLTQHCAEEKIELEWLFAEEAFSAELRAIVAEIVIAYLTSHMKIVQAAEDIQAFNVYKAFDKKPKKQEEFADLLYAKLVDDDIISVPTANLLTRSNRKRRQHIISTIRQATVDQPKKFYNTLKVVVRDMLLEKEKQAEAEAEAKTAIAIKTEAETESTGSDSAPAAAESNE